MIYNKLYPFGVFAVVVEEQSFLKYIHFRSTTIPCSAHKKNKL